ncbi:hypothetical protein [Streptomyces sp. NPDC055036]
MPDLSAFSDNEIRVLSDMTEEWLDRDRHGHLVDELRYSSEMVKVSDALYSDTYEEWKRRRLYG